MRRQETDRNRIQKLADYAGGLRYTEGRGQIKLHTSAESITVKDVDKMTVLPNPILSLCKLVLHGRQFFATSPNDIKLLTPYGTSREYEGEGGTEVSVSEVIVMIFPLLILG